MTKPTIKSPKIEAFLTAMTGKDRCATINTGMCMTCTGEARTFRDQLSSREYSISGMCQVCQDATFGNNPEPERVKCPDCPDGAMWTRQGPIDRDCPTCHGNAWIYKE